MFYKNKETKKVVFLIHSDSRKTIVFEYNTGGNTSGGIIMDYTKREFKKHFIKFKKCSFTAPSEEAKELILNDYSVNEYAYNNNFDEYIDNKKYLDRREEIEKQTEADRVRMLKELADDYNPNGVSIQQVQG